MSALQQAVLDPKAAKDVELAAALADASRFLDGWRKRGQSLAKADNDRQFRVGDWLTEGEAKLGDIRKVYKIASELFPAYSHTTLKEFAHVSRCVPSSIRIDAPWAHHKLVARFGSDIQRELLASAAGMSVAAFRNFVNEKYPPAPRQTTNEQAPSEREAELLRKLEVVFGRKQVTISETVLTMFGHHAVCPQHRYGRYKVCVLMTPSEIETMCKILNERFDTAVIDAEIIESHPRALLAARVAA